MNKPVLFAATATLLGMLSVFSNAGEAEPGGALTLGESANGQKVSVKAGSEIEVRLNGNITTGYSWSVTSVSGKAVKETGKVEYLAGKTRPGMVGAPGTFVARFKAVQAGAASINMAYARPFEPGKPAAKKFAVDLVVAKRN